MKPHVVAFIFARGGSKGVPGKNVRYLGGKPLIAHAIEAALRSRFIERVIVSTDSQEIAQVARLHGAEVPFLRPLELAEDGSPEWLAWRHAIRQFEVMGGSRKLDIFISVPTTSPLRAPSDLDGCIQTLLDSDADLVFTITPSGRNPYFNMVELDQSGYARLVIPRKEMIDNRQSAPPVYDIVTVAYASRPEFILSADTMFEGKLKTWLVPPERAIDIDTELDLEFAEFMMMRSKSVP